MEKVIQAGLGRSQIKKLVGELNHRHIRQRQVEGKTISYIEGWFAIAEANAIFGFDGWDRETLLAERLFEQTRFQETICAYTARVRIRAHAGAREVCRNGTGTGFATAGLRANAHEKALKAAETDATKRSLATFGNRFGLALYNKDRGGLPQQTAPAQNRPQFSLRAHNSEVVADGISPEAFCGALRQLIEITGSLHQLEELREANKQSLLRMQRECPRLVSGKGAHFAMVIDRLFAARLDSLQDRSDKPEIPSDKGSAIPAHSDSVPVNIDKSQLTIATEGRARNKAHLLLVAAKPCLICGEMPCHAHHVTFAQTRGLAVKVSDEFTVPLCAMHHNLLHMYGGEAAFWRQHGIEPLGCAKRLWEETAQLAVSRVSTG